MFFIKINSDITVCVSKCDDGTYEITSCDSQDHEGLLADGLTTIEELCNVLKEYFDV